MSFSEEKMDSLKNLMDIVKDELFRLEASSIKDLWIEDLEVFEEQYKS